MTIKKILYLVLRKYQGKKKSKTKENYFPVFRLCLVFKKFEGNAKERKYKEEIKEKKK